VQMWTKPESALLVLAPEAEALVKDFRLRFDPAAAEGVPAHITLLYPFIAPAGLEAGVLGRLERLFGRFGPFDYALAEPRRFPGVLYLAPQPEERFKALIGALVEEFPEYPPYGGAFAQVVPHLTVAQVPDEQALEAIEGEFREAAGGRLPIGAHAAEVALMDNRAGPWEVNGVFRLGPG
jgi:2'-5' RNA ligase